MLTTKICQYWQTLVMKKGTQTTFRGVSLQTNHSRQTICETVSHFPFSIYSERVTCSVQATSHLCKCMIFHFLPHHTIISVDKC